jgi:hypothetical protein
MHDIELIFCTLKNKEDGSGRLWITEPCMHCGKRHVYGAGSMDDDPREMLGQRVSHCPKRKTGSTVLLYANRKSYLEAKKIKDQLMQKS